MTTIAERAASFYRSSGMAYAPGLTSSELDAIEQRWDLTFSVDHREFLQLLLPCADGWLDWRTASDDLIRGRLESPLDGILFDIERSGFWPRAWGPRPRTAAARERVARERVAAAPRLIPLYRHRYLPGIRGGVRLPVFSVHQTDIIVYGDDLATYVENELTQDVGPSPQELRAAFELLERLNGGEPPDPPRPRESAEPRTATFVPFWSHIVELDPEYMG